MQKNPGVYTGTTLKTHGFNAIGEWFLALSKKKEGQKSSNKRHRFYKAAKPVVTKILYRNFKIKSRNSSFLVLWTKTPKNRKNNSCTAKYFSMMEFLSVKYWIKKLINF
jgi:hypothetical protein